MRKGRFVFVALICVLVSGCVNVSPWEKGTLARSEMFLTPDPLVQRLSDHVYFSKEASSSGTAVSGGGCGCN